MDSYVLGFQEMENVRLIDVGGKGLNLGELSSINGIHVPEGFCITTTAYKKVIGQNTKVQALLQELSNLTLQDRTKISETSQQIRKIINEIKIPKNISEAITHRLFELGESEAYAIRSSATAEDLPTASFAGQQDTYLNIIGKDAILEHISKCWASLFSERAITYRIQNDFDHRKVYLSVVVQRMIFPQSSGIVFTADPVTSNRNILSIDASFGLGEALVSGLVSADNYKIREGTIVEKTISTKKLTISALPNGGTEKREIEPERQNQSTLTDEQIKELDSIARKIEAHFSYPQDIEWCLDQEQFYIVQSRPITTLYPIPKGDNHQKRVYMSMGHQQMMTEPIKPLGISFFQILSDDIPLYEAGGRLFVDLTHDLASPIGRKFILKMMDKNDPLMQSAISNLIQRNHFIKELPRGKKRFRLGATGLSWSLPIHAIQIYLKNDPLIIQQFIAEHEASIKDLQKNIQNVTGDQLFSFILEHHQQLRNLIYDPQGFGAIMVGLYAANWINKKMEHWLGEKNVADILSQSVTNNVTSEMGLELLDVADVVRQYPAVIDYFKHATDETFFTELLKHEGGEIVRETLVEFLEKYGMRCHGEIDITRPRWHEKPTALIPIILSNIKNFSPGARYNKFEQGRIEAEQKEHDLLQRLKQLPQGTRKAQKTKKMISVLRNFIGYREYPKYSMIKHYFIYKQALLKEASKLVQNGVIQRTEEIYFLSFQELREVVRTQQLEYDLIIKRKATYNTYEKLTPPRIITSEGEIVSGQYNTDHIPQGALAGIPVSSGTIEGKARVVTNIDEAHIEEGEILVTTFTDPSWTPLFVSVKGLVTEVGGLMTHGSVIAREYGLPAVVGVENATKQIKDGQRIRVNGTEGYVELL